MTFYSKNLQTMFRAAEKTSAWLGTSHGTMSDSSTARAPVEIPTTVIVKVRRVVNKYFKQRFYEQEKVISIIQTVIVSHFCCISSLMLNFNTSFSTIQPKSQEDILYVDLVRADSVVDSIPNLSKTLRLGYFV